MMLFDISTLYLALGLPFAPAESNSRNPQGVRLFFIFRTRWVRRRFACLLGLLVSLPVESEKVNLIDRLLSVLCIEAVAIFLLPGNAEAGLSAGVVSGSPSPFFWMLREAGPI